MFIKKSRCDSTGPRFTEMSVAVQSSITVHGLLLDGPFYFRPGRNLLRIQQLLIQHNLFRSNFDLTLKSSSHLRFLFNDSWLADR